MDLKSFENNEPRLELEKYFSGRSRAWGVFQSKLLGVHRQFIVEIEGVVNGNTLTLTEDFVYADGETDRRIWTIRRTGEHTYEGTADDVIGSALGEISGNALHWTYSLVLPYGNSSMTVTFDDWMFLQDDDTLLNQAKVSKLGIPVGEVTLFFRREQAEASTAKLADHRITAASEINFEPQRPPAQPNGQGNGRHYEAAE